MSEPEQPIIWAVISYRAGESAQITGLAGRLGLPYVAKRLRYNRRAGPSGLARRVSIEGIDDRAQLAPPWPDLIISAGVKNEPLCRWVRAQSDGRTRLVFLGRTWVPRRQFDLVVTTPQYRLPEEPNVIQNLMTQHGVTPERLADAAESWGRRFATLRRPLIGVLLGGDSGPYVFGANAARRLARELNVMARSVNGSVLATSSARTNPAAVDTLERLLGEGSHVYRWRPDDPENPYYGLLAHADRLVVTSDSIAMLSEAAGAEKPVYLFDLSKEPVDTTVKSRTYAALMKFGPQRLTRDLDLFHQRFVADGIGAWLGSQAVPRPSANFDELDQTLSRVRALLPGH